MERPQERFPFSNEFNASQKAGQLCTIDTLSCDKDGVIEISVTNGCAFAFTVSSQIISVSAQIGANIYTTMPKFPTQTELYLNYGPAYGDGMFEIKTSQRYKVVHDGVGTMQGLSLMEITTQMLPTATYRSSSYVVSGAFNIGDGNAVTIKLQLRVA